MTTTYPVSYTSVSDVITVLPIINSASNINSSQIAYYCGRVEVMMNAKLSRSYALPFTQEIKQLSTIATDLSIYELLSKRIYPQYPMEGSDWPDRYKDALDLLDDIASGKQPLLTNSHEIISTKDDGGMYFWSNTSGYTPTFNEDPMVDSIIDEDKLDDINDAR